MLEREVRSCVKEQTCESCPLRRTSITLQEKALPLLELLSGNQGTLQDVDEVFNENGTPWKETNAATDPLPPLNALGTCTENILSDECERYVPNAFNGQSIDVIA